MPELPDITVYIEALERRLPKLEGKRVADLRRLGKRVRQALNPVSPGLK